MPHIPRVNKTLRVGAPSQSPGTSRTYIPELTVSLPKKQNRTYAAEKQTREKPKLGLDKISIKNWDVDPKEILATMYPNGHPY